MTIILTALFVRTDFCEAGNPEAQSCHIVEGKMSITVQNADAQGTAMIISESYEIIENAIDSISPSDLNVVEVAYIGINPSSLATIDKLNFEENAVPEEPTSMFTTFLIATSGSLVAMAALMAGMHRINKKPENAQSEYDDKSKDEESTAHNTADMTLSISPSVDDHSELGSISPSSLTSPNYSKHFVVAEEEESNWRTLGVISSIAASGSYLEEVSEDNESNESDEGSI